MKRFIHSVLLTAVLTAEMAPVWGGNNTPPGIFRLGHGPAESAAAAAALSVNQVRVAVVSDPTFGDDGTLKSLKMSCLMSGDKKNFPMRVVAGDPNLSFTTWARLKSLGFTLSDSKDNGLWCFLLGNKGGVHHVLMAQDREGFDSIAQYVFVRKDSLQVLEEIEKVKDCEIVRKALRAELTGGGIGFKAIKHLAEVQTIMQELFQAEYNAAKGALDPEAAYVDSANVAAAAAVDLIPDPAPGEAPYLGGGNFNSDTSALGNGQNFQGLSKSRINYLTTAAIGDLGPVLPKDSTSTLPGEDPGYLWTSPTDGSAPVLKYAPLEPDPKADAQDTLPQEEVFGQPASNFPAESRAPRPAPAKSLVAAAAVSANPAPAPLVRQVPPADVFDAPLPCFLEDSNIAGPTSAAAAAAAESAAHGAQTNPEEEPYPFIVDEFLQPSDESDFEEMEGIAKNAAIKELFCLSTGMKAESKRRDYTVFEDEGEQYWSKIVEAYSGKKPECTLRVGSKQVLKVSKGYIAFSGKGERPSVEQHDALVRLQKCLPTLPDNSATSAAAAAADPEGEQPKADKTALAQAVLGQPANNLPAESRAPRIPRTATTKPTLEAALRPFGSLGRKPVEVRSAFAKRIESVYSFAPGVSLVVGNRQVKLNGDPAACRKYRKALEALRAFLLPPAAVAQKSPAAAVSANPAPAPLVRQVPPADVFDAPLPCLLEDNNTAGPTPAAAAVSEAPQNPANVPAGDQNQAYAAMAAGLNPDAASDAKELAALAAWAGEEGADQQKKN